MRSNQTIVIFIALWVVAICMVLHNKMGWPLLLPFAAFVANELVYQLTGCSAVPSEDLTEVFYDLSIIPTRYGSIDHNYSEGYYPNGDYSISAAQAERNKFAKILEMLGVRGGDVILDMGCGTCSFAQYCAESGIVVVGLTLSSEQVSLCKAKGVRALRRDFTKFVPELEGTIDHVLMLGSTEHVHGGPHRLVASFVHKRQEMADLIALSRRYLRRPPRDDRPQRLFFSGLHLNRRFAGTWESLVLQRAYGGTLLLDDPRFDVRSAAASAGMRDVDGGTRDSSFEYYLATVLNENHFGNPAPLTSPNMAALFALGAVYPYALYIWVYYIWGIWMWMFDGRHHFANDKQFSFQAARSRRPCTLVWYSADY